MVVILLMIKLVFGNLCSGSFKLSIGMKKGETIILISIKTKIEDILLWINVLEISTRKKIKAIDFTCKMSKLVFLDMYVFLGMYNIIKLNGNSVHIDTYENMTYVYKIINETQYFSCGMLNSVNLKLF